MPPLISDIDLSVDDRWLYVSSWGTGELKQYDVSDIFHSKETAAVRLGGIARRQPHPAAPDRPLGSGPQMLEVSRDGRRISVTNSLYGVWDDIFYPDGVGAWMAKLDADPKAGGLATDPAFFPAQPAGPRRRRAVGGGGHRPRLAGNHPRPIAIAVQDEESLIAKRTE